MVRGPRCSLFLPPFANRCLRCDIELLNTQDSPLQVPPGLVAPSWDREADLCPPPPLLFSLRHWFCLCGLVASISPPPPIPFPVKSMVPLRSLHWASPVHGTFCRLFFFRIPPTFFFPVQASFRWPIFSPPPIHRSLEVRRSPPGHPPLPPFQG